MTKMTVGLMLRLINSNAAANHALFENLSPNPELETKANLEYIATMKGYADEIVEATLAALPDDAARRKMLTYLQQTRQYCKELMAKGIGAGKEELLRRKKG